MVCAARVDGAGVYAAESHLGGVPAADGGGVAPPPPRRRRAVEEGRAPTRRRRGRPTRAARHPRWRDCVAAGRCRADR